MKKALSILFFFILSTSFVFAKSDTDAKRNNEDVNSYLLAMSVVGETSAKDYDDYSKKDDSKMYLYILANGGFMPYNSDGFEQTGFNLGATVGGQLTKTFAMEIAYSYNNIFRERLLGEDFTLDYHDFKLNFLYSQHLAISDSMSLVPYAGAGLLYSLGYATIGTDSASNDDYGIIVKGGLRYKYKLLLVGVGVEYTFRAVETSTVGVNFEAGVIF